MFRVCGATMEHVQVVKLKDLKSCIGWFGSPHVTRHPGLENGLGSGLRVSGIFPP